MTDVEKLIAEAREHPTIAGKATVDMIDRLADALEATAAERDRYHRAIEEARTHEWSSFGDSGTYRILTAAMMQPRGMF